MTAREAFWNKPMLSWLLLAFVQGPATTRQGVFLQQSSMRLQSDSLVDIDDIPDEVTVGFEMARDTGLMCVTDLVGCCLNPGRGEWYHPDGSVITFDDGSTKFRRNRNQAGSSNLWRNGDPMQRGRFRCELPDAQNVNQIRYANILDIGAVSVSPAGTTTRTVGDNFSLQCSVDITPNPLPMNVPAPSFEWFFGSNNATLPSGVTVSSVTSSGNTYTSTLQFSPLQESHTGMYTCRLGGNARLSNTAVVSMNPPSITVTVTHDRIPELGSMYVLTCGLSGTERLSPAITYQWTRNNGTTQIVGTNSRTLSFSPLSLSDTGRYTCSVTVSSPYLNNNILASAGNSQIVMFPIPVAMVTINSNPLSPILDGTNVTLTCSVTMGQGVLPSDLSLLMVDTQLSRDGTTLPLTGPVVSGTTFTYTIQLKSFGRNDSGNYACSANVTLRQPSTYLIGMGRGTAISEIVIGVPPPLNVQASQSSASAPVEVSWSPPSGGAATITGYRIFYGNGDNALVPSTAITSVGLIFNENAVGQRVSIRSEAGKITSELINASIAAETDLTKSCSTEVGFAVGVSILLMLCVIAMVIIVIMLIYWRKEKPSLDLSGNMTELVYEDPDKLACSGQGNYELTQCPAYESTTSKPQPQPTEAQSSHCEM